MEADLLSSSFGCVILVIPNVVRKWMNGLCQSRSKWTDPKWKPQTQLAKFCFNFRHGPWDFYACLGMIDMGTEFILILFMFDLSRGRYWAEAMCSAYIKWHKQPISQFNIDRLLLFRTLNKSVFFFKVKINIVAKFGELLDMSVFSIARVSNRVMTCSWSLSHLSLGETTLLNGHQHLHMRFYRKVYFHNQSF